MPVLPNQLAARGDNPGNSSTKEFGKLGVPELLIIAFLGVVLLIWGVAEIYEKLHLRSLARKQRKEEAAQVFANNLRVYQAGRKGTGIEMKDPSPQMIDGMNGTTGGYAKLTVPPKAVFRRADGDLIDTP
ncbi:hypothetical protein HYFRA_00008388 [Hymenoscyphus fraxineus]|uniref:Uncharacterized protein n=1 Tax=Hymenoscyphus fraxineus TaxID=746836 RepID=A0A9N9PQ72_9HELO|nr:hypothetical protein HYFRA_00008388 [Hymenoscyphus fraxineus]